MRFARQLSNRCLRAACRAPAPIVTMATARDTGSMLAEKKTLRQSIKAALKQLSSEAMASESTHICNAVLAGRFVQDAQSVGLYVHCARLKEVDTTLLLQHALSQGKRVYVPLVKDKASNMQLLHLDSMDALVPAPPYGILEPQPTYTDGSTREDALESHKPLDLLLMPGLGFDTAGRRLGRGGGYYDKAISVLKQNAEKHNKPPPLLVALAYSAQIVPEVPVDEHDQPVDILATAEGLHGCTERGKQALRGGS